MRVRLFFLFLLICGFINAQEKRLALVIGNANYDKGILKNPVNDALLMKETLMNLGFDVILDTNLRTRNDLLKSINSFGERRKNYHVGFVYYAGHGVQIDGINYILPTKEKYESKIDVKDNGVNVDRFMEYFEMIKNEVNILVLDACRNNPYEKNWAGSSRSLVDGLGLAPLSSSGNIIAFSTSAGTTASDGKENAKNSSYCLSLVKNMMTPDLDLDQIFRNVRKEVREISGGNQLPTVDNHYEGSDFYFRKSTYTDKIIEIDSLIDAEDYERAKEKVTEVLTKAPNYKLALLRRGRIEYNSKKRNYNGFHLFKADSLYPNDPEVYEYIGRYYSTIGEVEKAIKYMDNSIKIDPNEPQSFYWRARFFEEIKEQQKAENDYTQSLVLDSTVSRYVDRAEFYERTNKIEKALKDYTQAISMDKENPKLYDQRANCYILNKDFTAALKDMDKAIDLAPNDPYYYNNRADFYREQEKYDEALKDYATALKMSNDPSESSRALNNRATIYENQEKFDLAIEEYTKAIEIYPNYSLYYSNRARIYQKQQNYELALTDYTQAISFDKENPRWYEQRADCCIAKEDFTAALKDLDKAIDLAPNDPGYYNNRADFYKEYKTEYELALKDYASALKLSKDPFENSRALNNRATIYENQEKVDLALEEYTKAIEIDPQDPLQYSNRARTYQKQQNYELALADYIQGISLDKENPRWYHERANCYIAKEDFTAALKDMDKAIDLAPNDPYYYNNRADFYKDYKTEYELAHKDYASALKLSKDPFESSRALNNRATIYENQEKFDLALEEYTKAIEIDPQYPLQYSNRARTYQKQQNYELALKDYTQGISLDKENPRWYEQRADCYIAKEDLTAALKDLDKAIDLAPNDPYYYINRADFYTDYKTEYELALKDYETALKHSKDPYESSRTLNNRATIYENQEKFDLALEEYTKAIEIYPNYSLYYSNRARIYQKQQNYELALTDYTQAISYDKENPRWYKQRADCYILNKDFTAALKDLDKAIELAPTNVNYLYERGVLYKETLNNNKKALDDFEKILEIDSTDIDALNYIGVILEDEGKYDLAIAQYEKGIALENINAESAAFCYRNRAAIFIKQNKFSEALKDFNKAIEISNEKSYSYQERGDFFISLGEYEKALIDLSLAIENTTTEKSYYFYRRAELYKEYFKNQDNAYEDYKKSIELDSTNRDALIGICEYKKSQGEINQAIKILDDWHSNLDISDSIRADYLVLKGMYNSAEGEIDEANKNYNKAIEIDSKNAIIFYQRGMFYEFYLHDLENAIKDYSMAIELEPENTEYYLRRSDVFFKLGNFKSQNKDILKVRKIDSKSIDFIGKEALVYASQGDFKKAIELSNEAISVSPENYMAYLYKAKVLIKNKDFSGSEDILKKVMEMEPNDPEAFFLMGKIYENKGENFNAAYMFGITENKFTKGNFIISDDLGNTIEKSEVYYEIGLFYEKMKAYALMCKMFSISINLISQNQLYRLNEIKIEIKEKLKNCQN